MTNDELKQLAAVKKERDEAKESEKMQVDALLLKYKKLEAKLKEKLRSEIEDAMIHAPWRLEAERLKKENATLKERVEESRRHDSRETY